MVSTQCWKCSTWILIRADSIGLHIHIHHVEPEAEGLCWGCNLGTKPKPLSCSWCYLVTQTKCIILKDASSEEGYTWSAAGFRFAVVFKGCLVLQGLMWAKKMFL